MINLLITLLLAVWISTIALISVQNATPVSIQFFGLQSVQIPVGVVLAFSTVVGAVGMGILQVGWSITQSKQNRILDDGDRTYDDDF